MSHTKLCFIIASLFLCSSVLFTQNKYQFIQRADNDILTYADTVSQKQSAPDAYSKSLSRFLNERKKQVKTEAELPFKYMQTFRIKTPDSNSVFAAMIDEGSFGMRIFLFYYNKQTKACSEPVTINAAFMKNDEEGFEEWNGKMLERPLVSFTDVDVDGTSELIFNRRAHNGTWNAVETIVYKLSDSKIEKWFSFYSKELKDTGTETMFTRKIKSVINAVVTLSVTALDTTFHITSDMPDETITIEQ